MVDDPILSSIMEQLSSGLVNVERRRGYLSFLIQKRFANKKLLQLEAMNIISSMPQMLDYLPEKMYDVDGKEKCDFWFETMNADYWLENKTR